MLVNARLDSQEAAAKRVTTASRSRHYFLKLPQMQHLGTEHIFFGQTISNLLNLFIASSM